MIIENKIDDSLNEDDTDEILARQITFNESWSSVQKWLAGRETVPA